MHVRQCGLVKPRDELMSCTDDISTMNREGLNGRPKDMFFEVLDDHFNFGEFWHEDDFYKYDVVQKRAWLVVMGNLPMG